MINRLRKAQGGFTLIELLVVVAIIALLATFAVPKLFEAINKSKKAPGQADMKTISSAMERHYFDKSAYPIGATGAAGVTAVKNSLAGGYLKSGTTYKNGYSKGYIYVSDSAGSFYVLVDPQNEGTSTDLTLTCNSKNLTIRAGSGDLNVYQVGNTTADIAAADVAAGCAITAPSSATATGANPATVVTN